MEPEGNDTEFTWTARSVRPIIILYVVAVFLAFMAFAHFVVHSTEAVGALLLACIGGVGSTVPGLLTRHEYRLSDSGLCTRPLSEKSPKGPRELFTWEELSHLVKTGTGFKYYKQLEEPNPLRRFWKLHVTDRYSGEFHVEEEDRAELLARFARRGLGTAEGKGRKRFTKSGPS